MALAVESRGRRRRGQPPAASSHQLQELLDQVGLHGLGKQFVVLQKREIQVLNDRLKFSTAKSDASEERRRSNFPQ